MIEWHQHAQGGDMPYSRDFGDYYFSKNDGRLECDHVFIKGNQLDGRFQTAKHITIAELGFGTGLNFIETMRQFKRLAPKGAYLVFHSFECHPLSQDVIGKTLSVWPQIRDETSALLDQWPDRFEDCLKLRFGADITLYVHIGDVNSTLEPLDFQADAWFLDGFAPERNRSMWSLELMQEVARHTAENGTFSSYTAAGWVRRNLQRAGFHVRKTAGYAHKREMICGTLAPTI